MDNRPRRERNLNNSMKILTTNEAAGVLSVSKRTIQELTEQRLLAVIKFGRNVRYDLADLERFAESRKIQAIGWKGGAK